MRPSSPITDLPLVGSAYAKKLAKINILTVEDLLTHIPRRYTHYDTSKRIADLSPGDEVNFTAQLVSVETSYTKGGKQIQRAVVSDETGTINLIWFNQRYLTRTLREGSLLLISGKVGFWSRSLAMVFPSYQIIHSKKQEGELEIEPTYPTTEGISSKWIRSRVRLALKTVDFPDEHPVLVALKMPKTKDAFKMVHFPKNEKDYELGRKRLAFNELLGLQITANIKRMQRVKKKGSQVGPARQLIEDYLTALPFEPTADQLAAINEITTDLSKSFPMERLLAGDVGSGKTVVAGAAILAVSGVGRKSALMAPTQILAEQHYKLLKNLLAPHGVNVGLMTSKRKTGHENADLVVGTHSIIHNLKSIGKLGLVVIDELHRFGVRQHEIDADNFLALTATPIPRTVALTLYGDIDVTTIKEMPKGRLPVKTWLVPKDKRPKAEDWIRKKLETGGQLFVVCPFIEESEHELLAQTKAVKIEYQKLKKLYHGFSVGILHGKMNIEERNDQLEDFKRGKSSILVSTPVIEVGIDIPRATIMQIESAQRFGLAQIHQLRGRVGRGDTQSYCLLFSETRSEYTLRRLRALTKTQSGTELAELDLSMRGPGEIFGTKQHGLPELRIARWDELELIKLARNFSEKIV